ncbi:MAG: hypothetical protein HUJ98_00750 [Bacteroidaceae bacterium]|nr:hypothetical protein [Bacteroidaceae bacterium]
MATSLPYKGIVKESKPAKDSLIHLEEAGSLTYDRSITNAQILVNNVRFRHKGAIMTCDSANFYQESNSFKAYGNVKMIQGDTLELVGDTLDYNGNLELAKVWGREVVLTHWKDSRKKQKSTLNTQHLDYDRVYDMGYFYEGGTLYDDENVLTSDWGEYHTAEHEAYFYFNVKLTNPKFLLHTDSLNYNTDSKDSHFQGPSNVFRVVDGNVNNSELIYSTDGYYNTTTEYAKLYGHSIVRNSERFAEALDSMIYDRQTGEGWAYKNVVLTDLKNKNQLLGDYCYYNDSIGKAMATGRAVAKDFSQEKEDTLFLHGDTLRMYTFNFRTDSAYRMMHAYPHVRVYRTDIQAVADSLVYNQFLSRMGMYKNPIVWQEGMQLLGDTIYVFNNDSTIEWAHVVDQALSVEKVDSIHYNQIAGKELMAYFDEGKLIRSEVHGNVLYGYYPMEKDSTLQGYVNGETTEMKFYLKDQKLEKIWAGSGTSGIMYPIPMIPADKYKIRGFVWLDYIRPKDKNDIFDWKERNVTDIQEIKPKRSAPVVELDKIKKNRKD